MKLAEYSTITNAQAQMPISPKYVMYCRKSSESDERQIQSLPDQMTILQNLAKQQNLQLVGEALQESRTAKIPGRPVFGQLVQMIEDGKINGIILFDASRLSRNTIDTARIIYLMDQGKLLQVVTPTQTYKNYPNDKFMLNMFCSQAKLENDNKSVNVKRALVLKAERGVFPGKARPGYKNNHEKPQGLRDISAHPIYFPLMRKLIEMALTGNYSIEGLAREAKKMGIRGNTTGNPICKSRMYSHLKDPFYTGRFIYNGKLYKGEHPALMTDEEFNLLQDVLDGKSKGKQRKHDVALKGIIKCGECHYCVTAETHTKRYKNGTCQEFSYYRCSKKSKDETKKCNQGYLPIDKLEGQVAEDLSYLELHKRFADWAFEALEEVKQEDHVVTKDSFEALQNALEGVNKRINNLVALKISPNNSDGVLLSDEEFADRKRALVMEKEKISQDLANIDPNTTEWAEIAKDSFDFGLAAKRWFEKGPSLDKQVIFKGVGSNPILLNQKLQFQLQYVFYKYKEGIKRTNEETGRLDPKSSPSEQAKVKNFVKSSIWCRGWESNPHGRKTTGF